MSKLGLLTSVKDCSLHKKQLRQWTLYLTLAALVIHLIIPKILTIRAQENVPLNESDYSLIALASPQTTLAEDADLRFDFTLQDKIFLNSAYRIDYITDYAQASVQLAKAEPAKAKTNVRPTIIDDNLGVKEQRRVLVTAYSSTVDQTDDSPFISANGTHVYDGMIACNFLPFGAKVRFPEYSGDKIYVVEDRMAKKNSHKIDIWMETRAAALQFGVRTLLVEVLE